MSTFSPGQRWTSDTEPELGLGVVIQSAGRRVQIFFAAGGEMRHYATDSAPLQRVRFRIGDRIQGQSGDPFAIEEVVEEDGLLRYRGVGQDVPEAELADTISFSRPEDRLAAVRVDDSVVFDLRHDALWYRHAARRSPVRGFIGGRIDLIPHQLYIAGEVTSRQAPRVLLSDEVGLGKTIEAGLILHRLCLNGRARRVLVLVPESLVHQWFIELLRRFNLSFSIFDEERCDSIEAGDPDANPFLDDQLILCSIDMLADSARRSVQAVEAGWDLLVVDEAHHLGWAPDEVSPEYRVVDAVADRTPGLLLLTATPEQLGQESHFARLRLLDPYRYDDLDSFLEEASHYREVADIADRLITEAPLTAADEAALIRIIPEDEEYVHEQFAGALGSDPSARRHLLAELLDQHGPGRVIFRNTRATMTGFPGRAAKLAALPAPSDSGALLHRLAVEAASDLGERKAPRDYHYDQDPRVRWLADFLNHDPERKVLLICSSRAKVLQLDNALRQRVPARIALFHEDLALVQRDRNAAWFAEEAGAQVLLCSEIGGEGRNFQFAHHLVLFDLPVAPERLEQRVGRLDRIGQTETIRIHIPYVVGSAQEVLVRWYHEGLDAVGRCLHGGHTCGAEFGARVRALVQGRLGRQVDDEQAVDMLVADSNAFQQKLAAQLERGRDHLLELSSFRPEPAAALVAGIQEGDGDLSLDRFMIRVFDHFGIEIEEMSERTYLVRPGPLVTDAFPGIPADGVIVTADRRHGLVRDDLGFLSWDHPMVTGAIDMLLGSEHGNSTFAVWESDEDPDVLLEALYVLEPVGGGRLHVDRFLPPTPIRVVVDRGGVDRTAEFAYETLRDRLADGQGTRVLRDTTLAQRTLPPMVAVAGDLAKQRVLAVVEPALTAMREQLGEELHRLQVLKKRNDHVREDELQLAASQIIELEDILASSRLRLDALRLICTGRW